MIYIDDIGESSINDIKTGKADLSVKLLRDNSLGFSFPFSDITKQQGTLHLCFPASDPAAPLFLVDASNADKEKGKVLQFSINNINTGIFRYNAIADLANGVFSLCFPYRYACFLRKEDLPLQFDGNFRINFCAKRVPRKPSKLDRVARDLEEQARRFQTENNNNNNNNPDTQPQNNENNTDEIDVNDDKNLNLSLDFLHDDNRPTYRYYNTFAADGCFTFDFYDIASLKLRLGASTKEAEPLVEGVEESEENPPLDNQIFEEEEEVLGNDQIQEPQTVEVAEPAENDDEPPLRKIRTKVSFLASIEGTIARSLNFIIATDEEKSTHEISFPIPRSDFSFGLCTSIYNGKKGLNSIGSTLIYKAKDGLSQFGITYETILGKDNAANSWNLGGGVLRTQMNRVVFAEFVKELPKPNNESCKLKTDNSNNSDEESLLITSIRKFRLFVNTLRDNLKYTRVFNVGSSLEFDFSNKYSYSKFSEGKFGVSCNLPEIIANNAQFQILTSIKQIDDQLAQKSPLYDYALSTRYSWTVAENTNLSLYAKVSTSRFFPSFGVKLTYKD